MLLTITLCIKFHNIGLLFTLIKKLCRWDQYDHDQVCVCSAAFRFLHISLYLGHGYGTSEKHHFQCCSMDRIHNSHQLFWHRNTHLLHNLPVLLTT